MLGAQASSWCCLQMLAVISAIACLGGGCSQREPVRIMSWNVLVGFNTYQQEGDPWPDGAKRLELAGDFLLEAKPDIIGWQELNGWTPQRLRSWTTPMGLGHGVLLKERGYDLGLSSRWPLVVVERHLKGMHHGLLHVRTRGIEVFVVHFSPSRHAHRLLEIELVMQRVEPLLSAGRPVLLMGDFNAASGQDDALFGETGMLWWNRWNYPIDTNGRPVTDVLQRALDGGLIDLWVQERPAHTPQFQHRPRIDFILASPNLAAQCTEAIWLDTPRHHVMSDHPPVLVELCLDSPGAP
ncbi:MAG: endonuclease/exonuclease/phosphatase family protein [Phycisphaerales bacterium]|nr:endonuclease/exonuclease/phosphatase family protein [Phycisphaerales bacterium]